MAKTKGRPYSLQYTAARTPRRYLLSGIPPTLWRKVRAQAKREETSMQQLILSLLEGWLFARDPKTQVANCLRAFKRSYTPLMTPEMRKELKAQQARKRRSAQAQPARADREPQELEDED